MSDLSGFNANEVPESTFGAMPPGLYAVMATESDRKAAKSGNGDYLQFVIDVLEEKYNKKKLWVRLNLWNSNDIARTIAQQELAQFCKAVNNVQPADSSELLNIPFVVELSVAKDKNTGHEENKIKRYLSTAAALAEGEANAAAAKPAAKPAAQAATGLGTSKPVWPGAPK